MIKFHKPDHREQLLIDSGFRCHLTEYARTTAAAPSAFVAKLRKYLKTRRVTSVSQVGTDRILEFQFSDGLYRLYLEFYAGGNIVLTDGDLLTYLGGAVVSLVLMAVHVWPWARPVGKVADALEADGRRSGLREAFGLSPAGPIQRL